MTIHIAQCYIDKLIRFLTIHMNLSQGHMVDYFTHSLYATCIPFGIRKEIDVIGYEETVKLLLDQSDFNHAPELDAFIKTAKSFSLYNMTDLCQSRKEFFNSLGFDDHGGLKLEVFMKSKKSHEVETLSIVARNVAEKCGTSHLVDIGDGKGYLSSLIAFHHGIPVLGVDGSLINTEGAMVRAKQLEKRWKSVIAGSKTNVQEEVDKDKGKLYKQITKLVTEDTNFNELIENVFLVKPHGIGLVGLHTCGNLGPTSIRIFNANTNIKSICNVSCCYHLLNENYLANSAMGIAPTQQKGFPMSAYVEGKEFPMKRSTRMLSAQSLDRILHNRELPSKMIYYRALLEIVLDGVCDAASVNHVGKFRKQPENFTQYAHDAFKKLNLRLPHGDDELVKLYEDYKPLQEELNVFHFLRGMLAPAIEALILLDRYLYLLEQGHGNVHLVKLFDPVISPRCYGLVSYRP